MNIDKTKTQNSLTREQKQAVGLLSIGTFLEYFDLMLYVHMAVLLNELFFPKTDPFTTSLLAAFSFYSTYLLRPIGALIFGYIGDNIGRKQTVIITTTIMSISCIVMANLPTYDQIGMWAVWIITICRIVQGMSSMGEIIGAELYLTELIQSQERYSNVALLLVSAIFGSTIALATAVLTTSFSFDWRMAFWIGALIAIVGGIARSTLRETPDFICAKKKINQILARAKGQDEKKRIIKQNSIWQAKNNSKTTIAYFLIECAAPLWLCLTYIYFGNLLKEQFNLPVATIIKQNFIVCLLELGAAITLFFITKKTHPLNILKTKSILFFIGVLFFPTLLQNITTPMDIFCIQLFIAVVAPTGFPAKSVFYTHFLPLTRFTYSSFIFAASRSIMYAVSSFGVILLTNYFGYFGLLIIIIPVIISNGWGVFYFTKLEKEAGNYY